MKLTLAVSWVLVGEGHACGSILARLGHFRRDAYRLVGLSAFLARGDLLEDGVVRRGCLQLSLAAGLRGANMSN